MKRTTSFLIILTIILFLSTAQPITYSQEKVLPTWSVYFSPNGGCAEAIINELDRLKPPSWSKLIPLPPPQSPRLF